MGVLTTGVRSLWLGHGEALLLEIGISALDVLAAERDVIDSGIFFADHRVDFKDRLVVSGQLKLGRTSVVIGPAQELEPHLLVEGDILFDVTNDDLNVVNPDYHGYIPLKLQMADCRQSARSITGALLSRRKMLVSELALKRNPPLVTVIYEKLESMILSGQLKSGEPINERALSLQFEVSRAPIREACRRLEQAGLVAIIENRGVFVREISKHAANEIYEIARLLSSEAAKTATLNVTDDDLERLWAMVEQIEADARSNDLAGYYIHNDIFHVELVRLGGNSKRAEVYRSLNNELSLYRQRGLRRLPDFDRSLAAHRRILEALENRDQDAYDAALEEHSSNMTERLLKVGV